MLIKIQPLLFLVVFRTVSKMEKTEQSKKLAIRSESES